MNGIEHSFLSNWEGWDEHDTGCLQFYNVTLNDDTFKELGTISENVDSMYFDSQNSKVSFYDNEGEELLVRNVKLVFA